MSPSRPLAVVTAKHTNQLTGKTNQKKRNEKRRKGNNESTNNRKQDTRQFDTNMNKQFKPKPW